MTGIVLRSCALTGLAAVVTLAGAPQLATAASTVATAKPSCQGTAYGIVPMKWGKASIGCAVFGDEDTEIYYTWHVKDPKKQSACVDGWGYPLLVGPTPDGRQLRGKGKWFPLGCGTRGGAEIFHRGVEWGDNLGPTKVRAKSLNVLPAVVRWSH